MDRIRAGVLGATGNVGQRFIQLLAEHPWFEITSLAASERSSGKKYRDACAWKLDTPLPEEAGEIEVVPVDPGEVEADIVFSALPSGLAREVEAEFARQGFVVASNASAHRMDRDVPLVIPEVNPGHLGLVEVQQDKRGWDGFIVTNPNCTTIMMVLSLAPLQVFGIQGVQVASMQAISGAGYDGVPSMAILDNVIPYIAGEEEKVETETLKLLGSFNGSEVEPAGFQVSASCHRVLVMDGHTEAIWLETREDPTPGEVKKAFQSFKPGLDDLPSEPARPIIVREEPDRPQPRLDRNAGNGMSVSVGRIRPGIRYIALGHNTIRGAAGASILNAELLHRKGLL